MSPSGGYLYNLFKSLLLKMRRTRVLGPWTLSCSAYTKASSSRIHGNSKRVKIIVCMIVGANCEQQDTKRPTPTATLGGARSKRRVLCTHPALSTTKGVGALPKPPSGPTHGSTLTHRPFKEPARTSVASFLSLLLQHQFQGSLA